MAIILEGPDAAGKSSLAKLLAESFGMRVVVSGGAPKTRNEVEDYCTMQLEACEHRDAVIDRVTPISHPIYNPAYRNDRWLLSYRQRMVQHPGVVVVYCRPPTEALMRPEKHQWKDYDTEEDKQKILNNQMVYIDLYDEVFMDVPHLHYDYTAREEDHAVELIAMLAATKINDEALQRLQDLQGVNVGG